MVTAGMEEQEQAGAERKWRAGEEEERGGGIAFRING